MLNMTCSITTAAQTKLMKRNRRKQKPIDIVWKQKESEQIGTGTKRSETESPVHLKGTERNETEFIRKGTV